MKRFYTYFRLEHKKCMYTLPGLLAGLGILVCLLVTCFIGLRAKNQVQTELTPVGIAMEQDEPYMSAVMSLLRSMDTIQEKYELLETTKENGTRQLERGEIDVLLIIPPNYVKAMLYGENPTIEIRFGTSEPTISTFLMKQLSDTVSQIFIQTEAGIYALDEYFLSNHLYGRAEHNQALNIEYIKRLLARKSIFSTEEIEAEHGLHYSQYYMAVLLLLFVCILCLLSPNAFLPENFMLEKKLTHAGFPPYLQFLGKHLALCCHFGSLYLCFLLIISAFVSHFSYALPDLTQSGMLHWFLSLLPTVLLVPMICACFQLCHELVKNRTLSTLTLFLSILFLGYLSGFFYPFSFLPEMLQHIAAFLPTRVAFSYAAQCVAEHFSVGLLVPVLLYTGILYCGLLFLHYHRKEETI